MDHEHLILAKSFSDAAWIQANFGLTLFNVLDYFRHCTLRDLWDLTSINEQTISKGLANPRWGGASRSSRAGRRACRRRRRASCASARVRSDRTGIEYIAQQAPAGFIIRKVDRYVPRSQREDGVRVLEVYIVLFGTIYRAPTLGHVITARMVRTAATQLRP